MNKKIELVANYWLIYHLIFMYCFVMNIIITTSNVVGDILLFESAQGLPIFLLAYLPDTFSQRALLKGLVAVLAHILVRRLTRSGIVTVIAVPLLTAFVVAVAVALLNYDLVQFKLPQLLDVMMLLGISVAPYVFIVTWFIVWRESSGNKKT